MIDKTYEVMKRISREKTFKYWFAYYKSYGTVFSFGGKRMYKFIEEVKDYNSGSQYDYTLVIVTREIGKTNYTTFRYNDIEDKEIILFK